MKKLTFYAFKLIPYIYRAIGTKIVTTVYQLTLGKCGVNTKIELTAKISNPWNVRIGQNVFIGRGTIITSESNNAILTIDNNVQISQGTFIDYTGGLTIDSDVTISADAIIYSHTHGHSPKTTPIGIKKEIHKNVWIGRGAYIGEKCTIIGSDSIIAARSTITKDVPSGIITAGSPAKKIGDTNRVN